MINQEAGIKMSPVPMMAAMILKLVFATSSTPKNTVAVTGKDAEKVILLVSKLEELDDVQNVYANFDMDQALMEKVMAE